MSIAATVTGVNGPGVAVTATVFTGVATMLLNATNAELLTLTFTDGRPPAVISIAAATTFTVTISGAAYTVTVS